jgi:ubiquinone biosynthesis protein UbiJ
MREPTGLLLPQLIAALLQSAINHVLRFAPATSQELAGLQDRTLRLDFTAPELQLILRIGRGKVVFQPAEPGQPADAVLTGPLLSVLRQVGMKTTPGQQLSGPVKVRGDVELVERIAMVMRQHDYDFEEPLSRLVGDVAAHQAGQALRSVGRWVGRFGRELFAAGVRMARDEAQWTPERHGFADFAAEVAATSDAVDRLEARLRVLRQKQQQQGSNGLSVANN